MKVYGRNTVTLLALLGALLALPGHPLRGAAPEGSRSAGRDRVLVPHRGWPCGMPEGIPAPEKGVPVLEAQLLLGTVHDLGRTPYGRRKVLVVEGGTVSGARIRGSVMPGGLDLQLEFPGGMEIEEILVLRTGDGKYIYMWGAGTAADPGDVRMVPAFEAPNDSAYAWLNRGTYAARRTVDEAAGKMTIAVFDVSAVVAGGQDKDPVRVTKPEGLPDQPRDYRKAGPEEERGAMLIDENVTLGPTQMVGPAGDRVRNIIPITGGSVSGRIRGKVLPGGADYQNLASPPTIDARYLWQTEEGEVILVRNGGTMNRLAPTFEVRVDGPYAWLNGGRYLSSSPRMGQGGVALTFYETKR